MELDGCSARSRFGGSVSLLSLSSGRDCRAGGVFGGVTVECGLRIDRGSDGGCIAFGTYGRACRRDSRDLSKDDCGDLILWSSMSMLMLVGCCIEDMSSNVTSLSKDDCGNGTICGGRCCRTGCCGAVGGCGVC